MGAHRTHDPSFCILAPLPRQYNNIVDPEQDTAYLCNVIANATGPLNLLLDIQKAYAPVGDGDDEMDCLDASYAESVLQLTNTTFAEDSGGRQWTYQTCNEFGFFQTADADDVIFSSFSKLLTVRYYEALCRDVFDIHRLPYAKFSNYFYGAKHNAGTNIAFVNGNIDPWHALGVTDQTDLIQPTSTAVFINGTLCDAMSFSAV